MDINIYSGTGNVANNPEFFDTEQVVIFDVVQNEVYKSREIKTYHTVKYRGSQYPMLRDNLIRGCRIAFEGPIQHDDTPGSTKGRNVIFTRKVMLLTPKRDLRDMRDGNSN